VVLWRLSVADHRAASATRSWLARFFLKHLFVQGEVGDHLFQPAILILELSHPAQLGDAQPA
jgi:hypothetical protein